MSPPLPLLCALVLFGLPVVGVGWAWWQGSVRPVLLWTDALVWLLVAVVLVGAEVVRRSEPLREGWRRVLADAPAMASAVLLAVFAGIGLADSVHFRKALPAAGAAGGSAWSVEVSSALDIALEGLRERRERTYSAPLAIHAFQRETVIDADGRGTREFPRLRHGGAHLAEPPTGHRNDVRVRALAGGLVGLLAAAVLAALGVGAIARARAVAWRAAAGAILRVEPAPDGGPAPHWLALGVTIALLAVVAGACVALSSHYHVLGTSKVGQSVLYLSLKSVRTSLVIGTLTTLVLLPFAVLLGIMAGYFRGWVDDAVQYVYTVIESIPSVLLIAAGVLLIQVFMESNPAWFDTAAQRADFRLLMLCVILGIANWTTLARLLRGEALRLRELEFVQAAHAFGLSHARIILRHLLPNTVHVVLIASVMGFSGLVLAEAVLSYVGVGVDPSMISFGTMINDARLEMAREPMVWWSLASAFAFMLALVLAANLFADAVRDAFDPREASQARGRGLA
jgi:peptide/nickel transport system permease protein